ncbi:hypothetical protein [Clostridium botulinum]|uniref:hypothetical protein n=1 Tax=Clostridium botulinum TaxID=1491 RepID=UPI001C9B4FEC|nr:hypothetical protein [Clostridium botulinum]MBY6810250.1 hypothetical protein [Clostridium botulinum]MBY6823394.1 hypothetical protein [Clostridium botulinum]MBY6834110.1 hypothetical protein [Clostridium botulinum]MBY6972457.1 hypothetical protein [Clostridium botulinum]MCS6104530.1 hypothetical protein [Clostridium botulinum]
MKEKSNYEHNNFNNNKTYNEDTRTNNIENLTEEDIELLRLLDIQKCAQTISIYADILAYISTLEGIELIYSKYRKDLNKDNLPNPDIPALQSVYLGIISRSMITEIGFIKYNKLYKKYTNGEITYSLKPNVDINIGNVLGLISSYYTLRGVKRIYKRNIDQPVLGV